MGEEKDEVLAFNLNDKVEFASEGIVSKTLLSTNRARVVLFCFDAGQLLSEHTSAHPASLHILSGRCRVCLGEREENAEAGFWAHMPAHLPHSIVARERTIMLLTIYRPAKPERA